MTLLHSSTFKVAVSGHRPNRLPEAEWPRLLRQLDAVMAELEASRQNRQFVLLSGLAEGADRLGAHAALSRGWGLAAVLPFSRTRYLADFPDQRARDEFFELLSRAEVIEERPPADRYADSTTAYAELGNRLVAEADALIVVWDGEAAQGPGGTVDVMDAACAKPIPVIWIHARQDLPPQRLGCAA